jgi:hypothetical protein
MSGQLYRIQELRDQVEMLGEFLATNPEVANHWGMRGEEGNRLVLSEGSKTYGRAFRLHYTAGESGAHRSINASVVSPSFLGTTKQEAMVQLMALRREAYLVAGLLAR